jgi:long-chain acyl-CoA synthetase
VAFVVAVEGRAAPQPTDLEQMCLDRIARYKRPKEYRFVESLPMNNYGKVLKRELRGEFQAEDELHAPGG